MPPLRELRGRRVVAPLHVTTVPDDVDLAELRHGAELLGFVPSPQQETVGRVLAATRVDEDGDTVPRCPKTALTEPRRAGKTEGLLAEAVGRCSMREGYSVAFSAQSGKKGRDRFLKMAAALDRWDPCPRPSRSNPDGCTREHVHRRIYRSNGGERVEWVNGSVFMVLPPDPEAYRGEEFHLIILDEAQETADPEVAAELLGGIEPTMDTVPEAQLIVAGTAGKVRSGLLWDALVKGRAGRWGIIEWAAPEHAEPVVIDPETGDVQLNRELVESVHPGIGTLTTWSKILERFEGLTLVEFCREYLGLWPADASVSAVDLDAWGNNTRPAGPRPARVGLAFDVAPDGSCAALACAWRDESGHAFVELLAFESGVAWLPAEAHRVARASRAGLAYDVIGANTNPADTVHRKRPPVKLLPMNVKDVQGAAQRLVSETSGGTLHHFGQKDLTLAVEGANWRTVGESGRAFGHKASTSPIVPLTSAALALWAYDRETKVARRRSRPASSGQAAA